MISHNVFKRLRHRDLEYIAQWEGFTPVATHFPFDPPGVYTMGYGHTTNVRPGQSCTKEEALKLLRQDAKHAVRVIKHNVHVPLSKNQFAALVSFVYNVGGYAFHTSTMRAKLNARDYHGAAQEFDRWVNGASGPLPGLIRRRASEKALFLRR